MRLSPSSRYELHRVFDAEAFEEDLARFPDDFDENGWPLFGECDRYALNHPITGQIWYENPRVPDEKETDLDYEWWYLIAVDFDFTKTKIIQGLHKTPLSSKENPNEANRFYGVQSKYALQGNLAYFRTYILPVVKEHLAERKLSAYFLHAWGEYNLVAERLGISAAKEKRRQEGRKKGGKASPVLGQLKFFIHWRQYADTCGLSSIKANRIFYRYCSDIAKKKLEPPNGFDAEWFSRALANSKTAKTNLADVLVRFKRHPRHEVLANQAPKQHPICPEIEPLIARSQKVV